MSCADTPPEASALAMHAGASPVERAMRVLGLLLATLWCSNAPATDADASNWFDEPERPSAPQVVQGELVFFAAPPDSHILQSANRLYIDTHSLADGWVRLQQCYRGLDPVPDAEIVYAYGNMRGLRIESQTGIASATVRGASVQLENVGKAAELCVAAEAQILVHNAAGNYALRNGPFHRRFLDGYFPMRVTLEVLFPAERLRLLSVSPAAQPGFSVLQDAGHCSIDGLFAGSLTIEILFAAIGSAAH